MAKILIAEDEIAINDLIRINLTLAGHECRQVFDGEAALTAAFENKFDLVLLDVMLPKLSGFEIIVADFGGKNLFEYTPSGSYAIVIGNEGNGVSDEVKSLADTVLTIPMDSKIESLNASVACALMMYNLKKEF
jgi:tRNA G18 (ribose-2'-O)-methylase SpoU